MKPRLMNAAIVHEARLLRCDEVIAGDLRLLHVDEAACRGMVSSNSEAHFVEWSDCSIGFTLLPAESTENAERLREMLLTLAYIQAREFLEFLNLKLFDFSGAGTRQ